MQPTRSTAGMPGVYPIAAANAVIGAAGPPGYTVRGGR